MCVAAQRSSVRVKEGSCGGFMGDYTDFLILSGKSRCFIVIFAFLYTVEELVRD